MKSGDHQIAEACESLASIIDSERDARTRMRHCRQALGLAREALQKAEQLTDEDMRAVQSTLRVAQRASHGFCDTNAPMTKLAAIRMERLGFDRLPIICETKPKRVITDAACLAIADSELPENCLETHAAIAALNEGRYLLASVGADGAYSVLLRHLDADEPFLNPQEYKKVVETSPPFRLNVSTGRVLFGALDCITKGVVLPIDNGIYQGQLVSLRSGRGLKFVATLVRGGGTADPFYQLPEFREP